MIINIAVYILVTFSSITFFWLLYHGRRIKELDEKIKEYEKFFELIDNDKIKEYKEMKRLEALKKKQEEYERFNGSSDSEE